MRPEIPKVPPGSYLVMRVDGTRELITQNPDVRTIARAIGADALDTVVITKTVRSGRAVLVMLVDDTGMVAGKPANLEASALVRAFVNPHYPYDIHGDVAFCNDSDFA